VREAQYAEVQVERTESGHQEADSFHPRAGSSTGMTGKQEISHTRRDRRQAIAITLAYAGGREESQSFDGER